MLWQSTDTASVLSGYVTGKLSHFCLSTSTSYILDKESSTDRTGTLLSELAISYSHIPHPKHQSSLHYRPIPHNNSVTGVIQPICHMAVCTQIKFDKSLAALLMMWHNGTLSYIYASHSVICMNSFIIIMHLHVLLQSFYTVFSLGQIKKHIDKMVLLYYTPWHTQDPLKLTGIGSVITFFVVNFEEDCETRNKYIILFQSHGLTYKV